MNMFGLFKRKKKKHVKEPEAPVLKEKKVEDQPRPTEEPVVEESVVVEEEQKKERKLPYHITKHPKGGWQLKKGKADRAMKRFDTQKEAIEYAEQLEKERGISFLIHKADGSVRKKKY